MKVVAFRTASSTDLLAAAIAIASASDSEFPWPIAMLRTAVNVDSSIVAKSACESGCAILYLFKFFQGGPVKPPAAERALAAAFGGTSPGKTPRTKISCAFCPSRVVT